MNIYHVRCDDANGGAINGHWFLVLANNEEEVKAKLKEHYKIDLHWVIYGQIHKLTDSIFMN